MSAGTPDDAHERPSGRDPSEKQVLVWDLPARVSHWGFACSLTASLYIGFQCDPEGPLFKHHMLAGILAAWFLLVRVILGFVGARAMRWRAFIHGPRAVLRYLAGAFRGRQMEYPGLNPGSALFAQLLYTGLALLIATGFAGEWVETWHGRIAWGTVGLIGVHLLGLAFHALRHRRATPLAMVHGWDVRTTDAGVASPNRIAGWILLLLGITVAWLLVRCFDETTSVLSIPGLPEVAFPVMQKG